MGHMSHYHRNPRWRPKLKTAAGNVIYISMYKNDKVDIYVEMCLVWDIKSYMDVEFKFMNSNWNGDQDSQLVCYLATKLQDICPKLTE